ncbi:MAG: alpha/beta hydrolase [Clostridia bacterium]|nr:alpha/beta hydrolase [Clostridia bacterium]
MIYRELDINIDYSKLEYEKTEYKPKLQVYIQNETEELSKFMPKRPTMLICPGGGYAYTSERECDPIAFFYLAKGYNCCILRYTCAPAHFPVQLAEAGKALLTIKENAEEWKVDTDKIYVCGFSAGGHLAASLGVFWDKPFLADILGTQSEMLKFNSLILAYPVISYNVERCLYGVKTTYKNLLGEGERYEDTEALQMQCLENHVSENTPPTFIWHTFEDVTVPVDSSLIFGKALHKHKVPFEMHIYEHGRHGQATGNKSTCLLNQRLGEWMETSYIWLEEERELPKA